VKERLELGPGIFEAVKVVPAIFTTDLIGFPGGVIDPVADVETVLVAGLCHEDEAAALVPFDLTDYSYSLILIHRPHEGG